MEKILLLKKGQEKHNKNKLRFLEGAYIMKVNMYVL